MSSICFVFIIDVVDNNSDIPQDIYTGGHTKGSIALNTKFVANMYEAKYFLDIIQKD